MGHAYMIRSLKNKKFEEHTFLVWENYTKIVCEVSTNLWTQKILPGPPHQGQRHKLRQATAGRRGNHSLFRLTCPDRGPVPERRQPKRPFGRPGPRKRPVFPVCRRKSGGGATRSSFPLQQVQEAGLGRVRVFGGTRRNFKIWYDSCGYNNCKKKLKEGSRTAASARKCRVLVPNPVAVGDVVWTAERWGGSRRGQLPQHLRHGQCEGHRGHPGRERGGVCPIIRSAEECEFYFQILVRMSRYQAAEPHRRRVPAGCRLDAVVDKLLRS